MRYVTIAGQTIRVFRHNGEKLYAAADVCRLLSLSDSSLLFRGKPENLRYYKVRGGRRLRVLTKRELVKVVFGAVHARSCQEKKDAKLAAQDALLDQLQLWDREM